jgi:hypothetical protein
VLDSATLAGMRWRPIGPTNMGGRVADVVGLPSPSKTFYVATAAGGIWKTAEQRHHVPPGVRRPALRLDGRPGRRAERHERGVRGHRRAELAQLDLARVRRVPQRRRRAHVELRRPAAVGARGRIQVDPRDANVAYLAALGPAWRYGGERGLYKTTDGGATWQRVKFVSDRAGFVDVQLDPSNPDVVWASSYERVRGPYFLKSGGPGSALWKSTDAGRTWAQVRGGGLPETTLGRISIAIARSQPRVMYLMVEADTAPNARRGQRPQKSPSGLYRSADGGATWARTNGENVRPFYYSQVRVHPTNPDRVWWSSTPVKVSNDGGKTARNATAGLHVDHHAMWIDPADPQRHVVGNDGGVAVSFDDGGNYAFPNTIPIGQFYNVSYDMAVPYTVCGGLQDNGSWCGPSRRRTGALTNAMWALVSGGDGFHTAQDPTDPNTVYAESQGGNIARIDLATGERTPLVKPAWRTRYLQFEDSVLAQRQDTAQPLTAEQRRRVNDIRTRQRADSAGLDLRWNWNTPFFLSPHNPRVLYAAANRVVKSTDRGNNLYFISPDLTYRDRAKIDTSIRKTGGVTLDATGAETFATIVSLAESPARAGMLVAGTDDGRVWATRTDGAQWEELTRRFPGVPAGTYVSRVEPSGRDTAVFYVTFDNHRRGDFRPYVYMTRDGGRSFRSIAANLPAGGPDFVHVVREDPVNPELLYLGTDVGVYVSTNRGGSWQKFMAGLPTVPVHDLKVHPRDRELIAGTHGRSIWIADVAPLQDLTPAKLAQAVTVFTPRTAYQYGERPMEGQSAGQQYWAAPSPAYGAEIAYRVAPGARVQGPVRVAILGPLGDTLRAFNTAPGTPGLHRLLWDMRGRPAARTLSPAEKRDSVEGARRTVEAIDSLVNEKVIPAQLADRIKQGLAGGPQGSPSSWPASAAAAGSAGAAARARAGRSRPWACRASRTGRRRPRPRAAAPAAAQRVRAPRPPPRARAPRARPARASTRA